MQDQIYFLTNASRLYLKIIEYWYVDGLAATFGAWLKDGLGTCKTPLRWVRPRRGMQDQMYFLNSHQSSAS